MLDPEDRATAMLFGDAGSATALQKVADSVVDRAPTFFLLGTDGTGADDLIVTGGGFRQLNSRPNQMAARNENHLIMDGGKIFAFTLRVVPNLVREILGDGGLRCEDLDALIFHQANRFLLRHLIKKIGVSPSRAPINIERFGNTSSASIPLVMATELADQLTRAGGKVLTAGFGVGYSWGAALMDLPPLDIAEMVCV